MFFFFNAPLQRIFKRKTSKRAKFSQTALSKLEMQKKNLEADALYWMYVLSEAAPQVEASAVAAGGSANECFISVNGM